MLKLNINDDGNKILNVLNECSPGDCFWEFDGLKFMVIVPENILDDYLSFVENIIGCQSAFEYADDGVKIMFSLSTLKKCIGVNVI